MGKTQLSLTFPHIRTYRKIEAIINHFATMKVFIILCIVIGITASLSEAKEGKKDAKKGVGHSAIQFKREAKKPGVSHSAIQFKRETTGQGAENEDAIAALDDVEAETGVDRLKREAKEKKKDAKKGVGHKAIQFKREAKKPGVSHNAIQFKREAKEEKKDAKKGVGHKAIQFKREAKEEKKEAKKGVGHGAIQFKREAKEEKKDQEKEVGGLFGKLAGALGAGLQAAGV